MKQFLIQYNIALSVFVLSFLGAGLGGYLMIAHPNQLSGYELLSSGLGISQISGAVYLLLKSDIFETSYFRYFRICIALFIVGFTFKIQHWAGYDLIFTIIYPVMAFIYVFRFMNKPKKNTGDFLKVDWVVCFAIYQLTTIYLPKTIELTFFILTIALNFSAVGYSVFYDKANVE